MTELARLLSSPSGIVVAILLLLALVGCNGTDACGDIRFRCHDNRIQLCNADGNWEEWQSCVSIGETCTTSPSQCGGYAGPCCTISWELPNDIGLSTNPEEVMGRSQDDQLLEMERAATWLELNR